MDALSLHRSLLRDAYGRHGGVEVDTQGDAFFYAFADAAEAVRAAEEGREALRPGPIHVRVGMHTGDSAPRARGLRRPGRPPGRQDRRAPATAGRCCSARRRRSLCAGGRPDARPRRAPIEGLRAAGSDLPARRRALPAPEDDLEHEPAPAGQLVRRPWRRGAGRDEAHPRGRRTPRHAHRPRRLRQDPPVDRGRCRAGRRSQGRHVLGRARADPGPGARHRGGSRRRSARRTASPSTSASARCSSSSTTSSR